MASSAARETIEMNSNAAVTKILQTWSEVATGAITPVVRVHAPRNIFVSSHKLNDCLKFEFRRMIWRHGLYLTALERALMELHS